MAVELMAEQDGAVFLPVVVGSVQWETSMSGSPGRLTFTVLEEEGFPALREGCRVSLRLDGALLFCGYVFTRVPEGRRLVSVTAYDQPVSYTHLERAVRLLHAENARGSRREVPDGALPHGRRL